MTEDGYPAVKPPWGTLNAYDLNKGDLIWQVPLGEYDHLTKKVFQRQEQKTMAGQL